MAKRRKVPKVMITISSLDASSFQEWTFGSPVVQRQPFESRRGLSVSIRAVNEAAARLKAIQKELPSDG